MRTCFRHVDENADHPGLVTGSPVLPGGNTDTKLDRKTALTLFFKKLNLKLSLKLNLLIERR